MNSEEDCLKKSLKTCSNIDPSILTSEKMKAMEDKILSNRVMFSPQLFVNTKQFEDLGRMQANTRINPLIKCSVCGHTLVCHYDMHDSLVAEPCMKCKMGDLT